jgi:hypothetical protein
MAWIWHSKEWSDGWWESDRSRGWESDRSRGGYETYTGDWQDRGQVEVRSDAADWQTRSRENVSWHSEANEDATRSLGTTSPRHVTWGPNTSSHENPPRGLPLVMHQQGNPSGDTTLPSPNVSPADPGMSGSSAATDPASQQAATDKAEALEQEKGIEWKSGDDYWRHLSWHPAETHTTSIWPSSAHDGSSSSSAHDGSHKSASYRAWPQSARDVRQRQAKAIAGPKYVGPWDRVGPLEVTSCTPQSRPGDDPAALKDMRSKLDADPKVFTAMYFHNYVRFTQQFDTNHWWQQHSAALKFFREENEKLIPVPMVQQFPLDGAVTRANISHPPGTSFTFDRNKHWLWDWKEFVAQLRDGDIEQICAGPRKTSAGIVGCSLQRTNAYDHCRQVAGSSTAVAACFQWHFVVELSDGSCASLHPAWSSVNVSLNWAAATDIMDDEVPAAGVGMSDGHGTFTYFKNKHVYTKLKFDKSKKPQAKASPPVLRPMTDNLQTAVAEQAPKPSRPPPEPKRQAPPTQPPTPATKVPPLNIQVKSAPIHAYALHGAPAQPHPPRDTERRLPPQRANPPCKANQPRRPKLTVVGNLVGGVTPSAIPPQAISHDDNGHIDAHVISSAERSRTEPHISQSMPEITGESMCPDMVGDEELPGVAAVADRCSRAEAGTTAVKPPNNGCPDTEMEDAESYAEQQRLERRFTWQWKKTGPQQVDQWGQTR